MLHSSNKSVIPNPEFIAKICILLTKPFGICMQPTLRGAPSTAWWGLLRRNRKKHNKHVCKLEEFQKNWTKSNFARIDRAK